MFCSKCGSEIEEGELFCGNCGEPVANAKKSGKKSLKRPIIIIILVMTGLIITAAAFLFIRNNNRLSASTMRIYDHIGNVNLADENGKVLDVEKDKRIFDGDELDTGKESKAWVLLDDDRMVTIMERSTACFVQSGKNIRLSLEKGDLFFYIARDLETDESFEISVSTMVIGIRGTSGYVSSDENGYPVLYLTSGTLGVTVYSKDLGRDYTRIINAGTKLTVITDDDNYLLIEDINEYHLPEDAVYEITSDKDLLDEVTEDTGWDKDLLIDLAEAYEAGVVDAGYSNDPDRLVGVWKYRDRPEGSGEDYYELREDGTGVYYDCNVDGSVRSYINITWDYLSNASGEGDYDGIVFISHSGAEDQYFWSRGMICMGDVDSPDASWYIRLEDDSFINELHEQVMDAEEPEEPEETLVPDDEHDDSEIIGKWVDTRYNYTYVIHENGDGSGPYGMTFTWWWENGEYHFDNIDMRFVNGVLEYGESYFDDSIMQSTTYYITLEKR